jgi:hypothetical protein
MKKIVSELEDDAQGQHISDKGSSVIRLKSFDTK